MKLYIIGSGDVGKFVAYNFDLFHSTGFEICGFLDDDKSKWGQMVCGYQVLGGINLLEKEQEKAGVLISIAHPQTKRKVAEQIDFNKVLSPSLVAKNAWLSKEVIIGKGVIIYPGVSINYHSVIEDHVILNMNCAIGHNCTISKYATLAPGASLGGYTQIGEAVSMGINAATKQAIQIGKNTIIGGMSMVIKDLPSDVTAVGVPSRIIKYHS
ncbi:MAG: NeuD/PglB/VioB family sugar acetyltransferase [Agriterribacter sp.]